MVEIVVILNSILFVVINLMAYLLDTELAVTLNEANFPNIFNVVNKFFDFMEKLVKPHCGAILADVETTLIYDPDVVTEPQGLVQDTELEIPNTPKPQEPGHKDLESKVTDSCSELKELAQEDLDITKSQEWPQDPLPSTTSMESFIAHWSSNSHENNEDDTNDEHCNPFVQARRGAITIDNYEGNWALVCAEAIEAASNTATIDDGFVLVEDEALIWRS